MSAPAHHQFFDRRTAMLLHNGREVWPEAIGKPVNCQACQEVHTIDECISVSFSREHEGRIQVPIVLVCMACVLVKVEPLGRA